MNRLQKSLIAISALFGSMPLMQNVGGMRNKTTVSTRGSINGQMEYHRDKKKHGTMSRRIARNKVMNKHQYS